MKKPNIHSLSIPAFLKLEPRRNEKINAASDSELTKLSNYPANRMAASLHPEKQFLEVSEIIEISENVKSFILVPEAGSATKELAYPQAGQYISVKIKIGELSFSRPYSLSSSPKEAKAGRYMITVKRADNGRVSNYILDNWTVGTKVVASAPVGEFTFEPLRDAKTIIGIAGGSGITPFRSIAKAIADGDEDAELILLYGSKTAQDAIFQKEFTQLSKDCRSFRFINVFSEMKEDEKTEALSGSFEQGFITAELISKYAPKDRPYSVFICGPGEMYNFLAKELPKLGLNQKYIRRELFGEPHNPSANADYPGTAAALFKLTVRAGSKTSEISCRAAETLLVSMEKGGLVAPSQCRSGECGFCRSRLVSGSVYVPKQNDGRRLADEDYGFIHPCSTFPLSDIVLEIPS